MRNCWDCVFIILFEYQIIDTTECFFYTLVSSSWCIFSSISIYNRISEIPLSFQEIPLILYVLPSTVHCYDCFHQIFFPSNKFTDCIGKYFQQLLVSIHFIYYHCFWLGDMRSFYLIVETSLISFNHFIKPFSPLVPSTLSSSCYCVWALSISLPCHWRCQFFIPQHRVCIVSILFLRP